MGARRDVPLRLCRFATASEQDERLDVEKL
jgi:hypothetical protein